MLGHHRLADGPMMPPLRNPVRTQLRRVLLRLGVAAVCGALLVGGHRPLLIAFAQAFRVDNPAPSDVLVLLLGGTDHRPATAAALYRRGIAPRILLARSKARTVLGFNESEECRRILIQDGVPPEAIVVLPGFGTSTREEAQFVREYVRAHPLRRITVVTTAFHTARARWIFRRVLRGTGVEVRAAASRHPAYDESDWYAKDESLAAYFSEAIKMIYYHLAY